MVVVGVELTKEINAKVDWNGIVEKLPEIISNGAKALAGDGFSGFKALASTWSASKSIEFEQPLGSKALELIILSFAMSVDILVEQNKVEIDVARSASIEAIASLETLIGKEIVIIPVNFFCQPDSSKPYEFLETCFFENLIKLKAIKNVNALKTALRVNFRLSIFHLFAQRNATYEELSEVLGSESALLADFDRQWLAYREQLIREFQVNPIFGQEETGVSLGQLYTPLRSIWIEKKEKAEPTGREIWDFNFENALFHVSLIEEQLLSWVEEDNPDDWLRLVGGGPGIGKSTCLKALASHLAKMDHIRPLFIPLQRLKISGTLRDTINRYFTELSGAPFKEAPLARTQIENGPKLVLIFDGLDELARPGENADEIARNMIDWVTDMIASLVGLSSINHKVVIAGRMPSFQAASKRASTSDSAALEIVNFMPLAHFVHETRVGEVRLAEHKYQGDKEIIQRDYRLDWWNNYCAALGLDGEAPAGLLDARLQELTAEPLLVYLLALSGYLHEEIEVAAENRNKIYSKLMSDVWKRGWGDSSKFTTNVMPEDNFSRLFEAMALAAWHGGDERVATFSRFEEALKVTRSEHIYADFNNHDSGNMSNLAVNFYLKTSDEAQKGFEFTHKSFGEYLTAKAIIRGALDLVSLINDRRVDAALLDWLHLVKSGNLTRECYQFIFDELRLKNVEECKRLKQTFEAISGEVLKDGFPAHQLPLKTWREAGIFQAKSEEVFFAILSALSRALKEVGGENYLQEINWNNSASFVGLIHRLVGASEYGLWPNLQYFDGVNLENQMIIGGYISRGSFDFFVAPKDFWGNSAFLSCSFINADLTDVRVHGVNFDRSDFTNARMNKFKAFGNSSFRECKLSYAMLEESQFYQSHCVGADFSHAKLNGSKFADCDLVSANFEGADLTGVDFGGADLRNANFEGADLTGLDFGGADLRNANFEGATLTSVNIKGAKIAGTILSKKIKY